jgi:hypothetical protein
MSKISVHQNPITIVTFVIPEHAFQLEHKLFEIKKRLLENLHVDLANLGTIHYARWFIIDAPKEQGNPDNEKMKLVFSSNFDGSINDNLNDLCTKSSELIDSIYQYCEGYPELINRTVETRVDYLLKSNISAASFYRGSPHRSLSQIIQESKLQQFLRTELDKQSWDQYSAKEVCAFLQAKVRGIPEFDWTKTPFKMPSINWLGMAMVVAVLLLLLPFLIIWILIVQFFYERKDKYFTLTRSQLNERKIKKLESYEDIEFQNQFTQLAIMKPGKVRLITFKMMMYLSRFLIKYLFNQGKLMGIPTIHFARWVLFDNNKRVMFMSNFDGSWQQYLGDFIDKSGWGLTGIFSNTTIFPKTRFLFFGGAYDEEHFLAWSRNTELRTQIWYNAYPHLSIKNVNNNSRIRSLLFKDLSEKKSQEFLQLI